VGYMEYAVGSPSLAHTLGNITSFITEYVKTLFPYNFFKTTHVSSTISYRQMNDFRNMNMEFLKKTKPILVIRPRVDLMDQDVFMTGTYFTSRILDSMLGDVDVNNLQEFISDPKNRFKVEYLMNRLKVYFDVTTIVETQMQQMNIASMFKNMVRQEHPFFLKTYLEGHVPKPLFTAMSELMGIPMYDKNGNTGPFLEALNMNTVYPITYKLKNSSGNDEFFRYYPVNVDTSITGLSIDDGNKKGFIGDSYTMNFTISTEFYTSGLYYFFTHNKPIINQLALDIRNNNDKSEIIPIFTISNFYRETLPNGWKLYSSNMYKVETIKPDVLDMRLVLSETLLHFIDDHNLKGIPMETFLEVKITKDNVLLERERNHYTLDYKACTITTNVCNVYSTYRIFIYVNTLYINNLAEEVLKLNNER
jgi:hypothetical protein